MNLSSDLATASLTEPYINYLQVTNHTSLILVWFCQGCIDDPVCSNNALDCGISDTFACQNSKLYVYISVSPLLSLHRVKIITLFCEITD